MMIPKKRTFLKIKIALMRKWASLDREYLKAVNATLEEWSSPEDEEAYRDL
jgi:hypothetical protein